MILSNQARCLKCGDEPYSGSRHHYNSCSCGNIFVDGGMDYFRHGGHDLSNYQNMSIEVDELVFTTVMSALDWCDENGRNNLGRACAVFRALRDTGYLDKLRGDDE